MAANTFTLAWICILVGCSYARHTTWNGRSIGRVGAPVYSFDPFARSSAASSASSSAASSGSIGASSSASSSAGSSASSGIRRLLTGVRPSNIARWVGQRGRDVSNNFILQSRRSPTHPIRLVNIGSGPRRSRMQQISGGVGSMFRVAQQRPGTFGIDTGRGRHTARAYDTYITRVRAPQQVFGTSRRTGQGGVSISQLPHGLTFLGNGASRAGASGQILVSGQLPVVAGQGAGQLSIAAGQGVHTVVNGGNPTKRVVLSNANNNRVATVADGGTAVGNINVGNVGNPVSIQGKTNQGDLILTGPGGTITIGADILNGISRTGSQLGRHTEFEEMEAEEPIPGQTQTNATSLLIRSSLGGVPLMLTGKTVVQNNNIAGQATSVNGGASRNAGVQAVSMASGGTGGTMPGTGTQAVATANLGGSGAHTQAQSAAATVSSEAFALAGQSKAGSSSGVISASSRGISIGGGANGRTITINGGNGGQRQVIHLGNNGGKKHIFTMGGTGEQIHVGSGGPGIQVPANATFIVGG